MARKIEKGGKFRNVHCRTWNMARKLMMPRDMLGDAATLGDGTDTGKARVIMRNGEYPAVLA